MSDFGDVLENDRDVVSLLEYHILARVFIPTQIRDLTDGREIVDVTGSTVREVIDGLESVYPGTRARLCKDDQLRSGLMIAIDSSIAPSGLRTRIAADAEIHFLPAIGGG